jgi:hypothetical protein
MQKCPSVQPRQQVFWVVLDADRIGGEVDLSAWMTFYARTQKLRWRSMSTSGQGGPMKPTLDDWYEIARLVRRAAHAVDEADALLTMFDKGRLSLAVFASGSPPCTTLKIASRCCGGSVRSSSRINACCCAFGNSRRQASGTGVSNLKGWWAVLESNQRPMD